MKNILFIILLLAVGSTSSWAQDDMPALEEVGEDILNSNGKKVKADKSYGNLGYMKSIELYQGVQDKSQQVSVPMMAKMANAYRLNGDSKSAEYWYARYINKADNQEDLLHYAQALQSNGKCEDAVRWFNKYKEVKGDVKMEFIGGCDELEDFIVRKNVKVMNAATLNSEQLDFSPIPHKEGLVFTSNRDKDPKTCCRDSWTNKDFTDLFFADIANNAEGGKSFSTPRRLPTKINKKTHDGAATFSADDQTMIFTRNNQSGPAENDVVKLQLYSAQADGPGWKDVQRMALNSTEWTSGHPSLSQDGNRLYFASNRQGGFGGMDIWVSKNENGQWATPVNLGPEVNSAGNELFPYISKDNLLFFASDGHKGLGGLDIFTMKRKTEGDENSWSRRRNMGQPINSAKDDFAYVIDKTGEAGYFTSNRDGGLGGDDIYLWEKDGPDEEQVILTVSDAATGELLENVTVNLTRQPSTEEDYTTDAKGSAKVLVMMDQKFDIKASKSGYLENNVSISAVDWYEVETYNIDLERPKSVPFKGITIRDKDGVKIPLTDIKVLEKCSGETLEAKSGENGEFTFDLKCDCDYELVGRKEKFKDGDLKFSVSQEDCNKQETIEKELRLADAKEEITLILNDIYYNFDRANIRSDAGEQLAQIVSLMQKYQSLEIALHSHTDCRGSDAYNDRLSQRRANEAKEYIISQGIAADRITLAVGHGEKELTNNCSNGVSCTKAKHQANRRTEIRIVKFDEPDVTLKKQ